jgi:hypothetical protein
MNDDYLYDKSGEPDPEVVRLEKLLARYRYTPRALPALEERRAHPFRWIALAAGIACVAFIAWLVTRDRAQPKHEGLAYQVEGVRGVSKLSEGVALETGALDKARVAIGSIGHVEVAPNSSLRVEPSKDAEHSFFLARGSVHAKIFTQPRAFQIGTPAGRSIDLGCEYSLDVDANGASTLRVMTGQVAFELDGREVYVPANARCTSVPGRGPSAPVFERASPEFVAALAAVEFKTEPDLKSIEELLAVTEREDTLTLWHLYDSRNVAQSLRDGALEYLERTFPLPEGVTSERIHSGDRAALQRWLDSMKPAWRSAW